MTLLARVAIVLAIALTCVACASSRATRPSTSTPIAIATTAVPTIKFSSTTITWTRGGASGSMRVEVASTPEQGERGLSYRDALPEDAGMLFDLHETRVPQFWMKGMRFALDMVWIGADRRIVAVTANVQPQPGASDDQLLRVSPPEAVRYVLELNAGSAQRHGMDTGTELAFELPPAP